MYVFSFNNLPIHIVCTLELKRIRGNKMRKFYWNKKNFNVKNLALLDLKLLFNVKIMR